MKAIDIINFINEDKFSKYTLRQIYDELGPEDFAEYLKDIGFDEKAAHEKFLKKASIIQLHSLPDRVPEIKKVGGGDDRANPGKNIRLGGFGEQPNEAFVEAR